MSIKENKKNEQTYQDNINLDKLNENESFKYSNNLLFSTNNTDNLLNNTNILNNYKQTNVHFVQNEPLLKPDNFNDIFNQFNNLEINNNNIININSNKNNNKEIKTITLKLKNNISNNISNYNFNDSNDINSSKFEQIKLLEDSTEMNNKFMVPSNDDKQIEIINIQSNFPQENSMNYINNSKYKDDTIRTIPDEENENINNNYNINNQNINEINIENKMNKNNKILDIETISENNIYSPENYNINKNPNEIDITFNKNKNQNNFLPPLITNQNIESSPFQISSFDSKKEKINSININPIKDNFLSPNTHEISPILKIITQNSNEMQNQTNFHNIENNPSILRKNFFEKITPLIQQKDQEYIEKLGKAPSMPNIKNFQIKINKIDNKNNIDAVSVEHSTKIVANTIIKEISNSNDIIDENNIDNNEIEKNINLNNVKEIPQDTDNEYNYEPTNLSFILSLNINNILNENKFNQVIGQINEHEKCEMEKMGKEENEIINNELLNKNRIMYTINEVDEEDSFKNSNISKNKTLKIDEKNKNKNKNSSISVDKNNSQNSEVYRNKSIINDIDMSSAENKSNFLSLSANNMYKNEKYSSPHNRIIIENNKDNENIYVDEDIKNIDDINNENKEFLEYFNPQKNIINNIINKRPKTMKENEGQKKISIPTIDNNKININLEILKDKLKEIDKKFEEHSILIDKKNKESYNINNNINIKSSLNNHINDTQKNYKSNYLFENILNNKNNNNINNINNENKNYNINILFKSPYNYNLEDNNFNNNKSYNTNINNINLNLYYTDSKINNNNKDNFKKEENDNKSKEENLNMSDKSKNKKSKNENEIINNKNDKEENKENNKSNKSLSKDNLLNNNNDNNNDKNNDKNNDNLYNPFKENNTKLNNNSFKINEDVSNIKNEKENEKEKENISLHSKDDYDGMDDNNQEKNNIENEFENESEKQNDNEPINKEEKTDEGNIDTKNNNKFDNNLNEKSVSINNIDNDNYFKEEKKTIKSNSINDNIDNNKKNNDEAILSFHSQNKSKEELNDDIINNKPPGPNLFNNNEDKPEEKNLEFDFSIDNENENENEVIKNNNIKNNENEANNFTDNNNNKYNSGDINDELEKDNNNNSKKEVIIEKQSNNTSKKDNSSEDNDNDNDNCSYEEKKDERIILNVSNIEDENIYNQNISSPEFNSPIKESKENIIINNNNYNNKKIGKIQKINENENNNNIITNINIFTENNTKNRKKYSGIISIEQINNIKKNYNNLNISINDSNLTDSFLKYIIIDDKMKKLLFSKNFNNKGTCYNIPLSSYLLILHKIGLNQKTISKFNYESLIKKFINLTSYHKQIIQKETNLINNENNANIDENNQILDTLFLNFKTRIEELKEHYIYYLNNKKKYINNKNELKKLEKKVNIPQKREDLKMIYKDLILYINTIYKNSPYNKIKCFKKIINYLKDYGKINDKKNKNSKELEAYKKNDEFNMDKTLKDKQYKKALLIGGVIIPLFYIINYFYSNFK